MRKLGLAAALLIGLAVNPAHAQIRAATPTPPPSNTPGYKASNINPMMLRLNQLQAQIDALKESAGKQVVVLHFAQADFPGTQEHTYSENQELSASLCQQALGDRYGRVISYRVWTNENNYYFSHVVCETNV